MSNKNFATFSLSAYDETHTCCLVASRYLESSIPGGGLYLGTRYWDEQLHYWGAYCDISTNLPETSIYKMFGEPMPNSIFIRNDEEWYPSVKKFFLDTKLAYPTSLSAISGFCTYDEWRVDLDKLKELAAINDFNGEEE